MKTTIFNRKLIVLILVVILAICAFPGMSYGFFDDLLDIFVDVVEGIVNITVGVVNLAVGVTELAVGVADLAVSLALTHVGHTACVLSTVFSPDGTTLASGSCDFTVLLWDPTGLIRVTLMHLSPVWSTAFCPIDGCMLASGTENGNLHLWLPDTGQLKTTLTGHTAAILSTAFSPVDHNVLASGSADRNHPSLECRNRRAPANTHRACGQCLEYCLPPRR